MYEMVSKTIKILQVETKHNSLIIKKYAEKSVYLGNTMVKTYQCQKNTFS